MTGKIWWRTRGDGGRFLAALTLLVFVSTPLAVAQPEDLIAFVTPQGELATVTPDGEDVRVLSESGRRFSFPTWSPQGDTLAAIGVDREGVGVYVFAMVDREETPTATELYRSLTEPPIYLYFSPDGRALAFLANHPGGLGFHVASLETLTSRLRATGSPFYWDWTADGERLLVHAGFVGPEARLGFLELEGEGGVAENLAVPGFFQAPSLSSGGRYLAYGTVDASGGGRLVIRNAPDVVEETVRELPHRGFIAFGWNPTHELLALMNPPVNVPRPYGPIRTLDAETGILEGLVDEIAIAFFWSPNGRYLAYFTPVTGGGSDVVEGAGELRAGGLETRSDAPSQSPFQREVFLNLSVVDLEENATQFLTTFRPSLLFLTQFLPFFDQYALSHRLWSPRSDALVLPMLDEGDEPQVFVVSLAGEVRSLVSGDLPFWRP